MDNCNHKPLQEACTREHSSLLGKTYIRTTQTCRYCGEEIVLRNPKELPCKRVLGILWMSTSYAVCMLCLDIDIDIGVILAVASLIYSLHFLTHIGRYLHWNQVSENDVAPTKLYQEQALGDAQERLERDRYRG